jgi:hypothetical protein
MTSDSVTPEDYIAQLPADRKGPMIKLRNEILKNIPAGFKESMTYGMIGYCVPHSLFPKGYHCDPSKPLGLASIASQKNFIAVYHMGIYGNTKLLDWFVKEYPKHTDAKLDMGKACIRFKNPEKIPFKLFGELMSKLTVKDWIKIYEDALAQSKVFQEKRAAAKTVNKSPLKKAAAKKIAPKKIAKKK